MLENDLSMRCGGKQSTFVRQVGRPLAPAGCWHDAARRWRICRRPLRAVHWLLCDLSTSALVTCRSGRPPSCTAQSERTVSSSMLHCISHTPAQRCTLWLLLLCFTCTSGLQVANSSQRSSNLRHWAAFAANTLGHTKTIMWPDALCSPSLAAASALCATTPCGMPALGGQGHGCRQTQSLRDSSEPPWHSAAPRKPARACCGQLT